MSQPVSPCVGLAHRAQHRRVRSRGQHPTQHEQIRMRPHSRQLGELLFGWGASEFKFGEHPQSPGDRLHPGLVKTTVKEQAFPSVVAAVNAVRIWHRDSVDNRAVT